MNQNSSEQNAYQAEIFSNRLAKRYKYLRKWARRERVTCYRLYDRDIPEVPLAVDIYEFLPDGMDSKTECARLMHEEEAGISKNDTAVMNSKIERCYLHVYLYERPYKKDDAAEKIWLDEMCAAAADVTGVPRAHVIQKLRKRQRGESQYEKIETDRRTEGIVQECGQLFKVNLSDYLDTGIFFDHRPLRSVIRATASGKSVLNLCCYTGSFSVYAAEGKAKRIESVDLSRTYLEWTRFHFALNDFDPDNPKYVFTRDDIAGFIDRKLAEEAPDKKKSNRYDIIILDPPTFSNSKKTHGTLDINRDWPILVSKCLNLLTPDGILYFSTNSQRLRLGKDLIPTTTSSGAAVEATDMTDESIPEDYKNTKPHRLWKFHVIPFQKEH